MNKEQVLERRRLAEKEAEELRAKLLKAKNSRRKGARRSKKLKNEVSTRMDSLSSEPSSSEPVVKEQSTFPTDSQSSQQGIVGLVKNSQDPHVPIWLSGLGYPAQYYVRQTRSMSQRGQSDVVEIPLPTPQRKRHNMIDKMEHIQVTQKTKTVASDVSELTATVYEGGEVKKKSLKVSSVKLDDFQERLVDTCWNDEDVGHLVCLSATVKLTHHPGLNSDLYMWIWMSQNNGWKMIRQVHLESAVNYIALQIDCTSKNDLFVTVGGESSCKGVIIRLCNITKVEDKETMFKMFEIERPEFRSLLCCKQILFDYDEHVECIIVCAVISKKGTYHILACQPVAASRTLNVSWSHTLEEGEVTSITPITSSGTHVVNQVLVCTPSTIQIWDVHSGASLATSPISCAPDPLQALLPISLWAKSSEERILLLLSYRTKVSQELQPPTLGPQPPTLGPQPPTLGPQLPTLGPQPPTLGPQSSPTLGPQPSSPALEPQLPTLGPQSSPTLEPQPPTLGPQPPTLGPPTPGVLGWLLGTGSCDDDRNCFLLHSCALPRDLRERYVASSCDVIEGVPAFNGLCCALGSEVILWKHDNPAAPVEHWVFGLDSLEKVCSLSVCKRRITAVGTNGHICFFNLNN